MPDTAERQPTFQELYARLTIMQQRFVDNLLADPRGNASEALRKAGSRATRVDAAAHEMLTHPNVAAALEAARREAAQRTEVTVDRVVQELARLGFANMLDYVTVQEDGTAYVNLSKLNRDQAAAIQEVTVTQVGAIPQGDGDTVVPVHKIRFKLGDKKGALELLGKYLGMFTERVKHEFPEGSVGVLLLPARADEAPNGEEDGGGA